MNHPSREEWMAHLYSESDTQTRADLEAHLAVCPDCKESVAGWRRTMGSLDHWTLPVRQRIRWSRPVLVKWAAAAAVTLALGFGFGRLTSPVLDLQAAHDQLLPALREQLRQDLAVAMDVTGAPVATEFQRELRNGLDRWATASVNISTVENRRVLAEFIEYFNTARAEDKQALLALVKTLRADVETVAVNTDTGFKNTQTQLNFLAASTQPEADLDADDPTLP